MLVKKNCSLADQAPADLHWSAVPVMQAWGVVRACLTGLAGVKAMQLNNRYISNRNVCKTIYLYLTRYFEICYVDCCP